MQIRLLVTAAIAAPLILSPCTDIAGSPPALSIPQASVSTARPANSSIAALLAMQQMPSAALLYDYRLFYDASGGIVPRFGKPAQIVMCGPLSYPPISDGKRPGRR